MKQIAIVFGYTFRDAARKKAFKISTAIILALILILCLLPGIVSFFSGDSAASDVPGIAEDGTVPSASDVPASTENDFVPSETDISAQGTMGNILYYTDDAKLIENGEDALRNAFGDRSVVRISADGVAACTEEIADNGAVSLVQVTEMNGLPFLTVVNQDFMTGIDVSAVTDVLTASYVATVLAEQGISEEIITFAQMRLSNVLQTAGTMNLGGYMVGIVLTMLIFFAVYYYGYGVSMSVATEKTSRVMETLIVSAKPSYILLGKCLAMGALGLCQFVGILLFGALCYRVLIPADFALFGEAFSFSSFTVRSALLILLYFLLGYALYAVMNAVCGASVSKIEDLNSAMMPVMMIALISFYVAYFVAISTTENTVLQRIAMYIPFCSPFIMPFKLLNGEVATLDLIISVASLVLAIVLVTLLSIRIYSASVLHYGKRLKIRDAYRMKV